MAPRICLAITLSLFLVGTIYPQQNSRTGEVRAEEKTPKAVQIIGKVDATGSHLATDDGGSWKISNPSVLTGQTGKIVTVKCLLSPDQSSIHVLSIMADEKNIIAYGDSAFRR